jgi:hypothetical protein
MSSNNGIAWKFDNDLKKGELKLRVNVTGGDLPSRRLKF